MTPAVSPAAVAEDTAAHGRLTACSWSGVGWRSLLVRSYETPAPAGEVETAAIADQRIVVTTDGAVDIEARVGRRRRRAAYVAGRIGMTAPGVSCSLEWRHTTSHAHAHTHVFIPGETMTGAAQALLGREVTEDELADTLLTDDPVVAEVVRAVSAAARAGLDDLYAESAATFLAAHLVARGLAAGPVVPAPTGDPRIRAAVALMHDDIQLPLTLADLATAAGLSPYHFLRLFKQEMGVPPRRYLTGIRVSLAAQHLRRSTLPVSDIAYLCGFSSPPHLVAAFRSRLGTTPTAYRSSM